MIRWGKAEKIIEENRGGKVEVKLNSLEKNDVKFKLIKKEAKIPFVRDFVPEMKEKSTVAVHWNQVIKVLTEKEAEKLEKWSKKTLEIIN
jgi:hypothetical protein